MFSNRHFHSQVDVVIQDGLAFAPDEDHNIRVLLETSAQYLLGVDVAPEDRGSKTAQIIKVKVKPKGATVRHRMSVVIPK